MNLFVVLLTYTQPLSEVEKHLEAHRAFLDRNYVTGTFLVSGPQIPRCGGVLLARATSKEQLDALLNEDPFRIAGVADYRLVEFRATKQVPALDFLAADIP